MTPIRVCLRWMWRLIPGLFISGFMLGCDKPEAPAQKPESALSGRVCDMKLPEATGVQAKCLWYQTNVTAGFSLPAVLFSKTHYLADRLLVYIPGGPGSGGQTSASQMQYWFDWYTDTSINADLLIYSPRGTAGSHPHWVCPEYENLSLTVVAQNISFEQESRVTRPVLDECLARYDRRLKSAGNSLGLGVFSSREQARDILGMIEQLGYRESHLWGVSYGSRVALVAAGLAKKIPLPRATPRTKFASKPNAAITSLILDSPYPPGRGGLSNWSALRENALALHASQYQKLHNVDTQAFYTLWKNAIQKAVSQNEPDYSTLGAGWVFNVSNWYNSEIPPSGMERLAIYTHENIGFALNDHRLIALMFFSLYDTAMSHVFYEALAEMSDAPLLNENKSAFASTQFLLDTFVNSAFEPNFNSLVFYSAECADNQQDTEADYNQAYVNYPGWAAYLKTLKKSDICSGEYFNNLPNLKAGINVSNPTMVIAGTQDHVTPMGWAQALVAGPSAANRFLVAVESPHSVLGAGACSSQLLGFWLEAAENRTSAAKVQAAAAQYCNNAEQLK